MRVGAGRIAFRARLPERRARVGRPPRHHGAASPSAVAAYTTISVGGPLRGLVTLTAPDPPRVIVQATWGGAEERTGVFRTVPGEREALMLANLWADQLIDGVIPAS